MSGFSASKDSEYPGREIVTLVGVKRYLPEVGRRPEQRRAGGSVDEGSREDVKSLF